jgi:diacylglycerol kinase family enzyme
VTRALLRQKWSIPGIDLVHSDKVSCQYLPAPSNLPHQKIYAEADGELLGTLPVEMTIVPDALTLLA